MIDELEKVSFVRKPFVVDAIEVTRENIADIAPRVGDLIEDGDKVYIRINRLLVPTFVPGLTRVYPGYFVTFMKDNVRVYSRKVFKDQFVEVTPETEAWIQSTSSAD